MCIELYHLASMGATYSFSVKTPLSPCENLNLFLV